MNTNSLKPLQVDLSEIHCPAIDGKEKITERYSEYIKDESKLIGKIADKIFFPTSTLEVSFAVKEAIKNNKKITVSGSRTGIVGGAVPVEAGYLVSLENLTLKPEVFFDIDNNCWAVKVGAGVKLEELQKFFRKREYKINKEIPDNLIFPVDPTEITASIGGMVAANASGARTLRYGATREWVLGLKIILSDGSLLELKRGQNFCENNSFFINLDEKLIKIETPGIHIPSTKHVAGYFIKNNMDVIDLFIGGEGTLGIVTEVVLKLEFRSEHCLYLSIFFRNENYLEFVKSIKKSDTIKPIALEFLDERSVELLKEYKEEQGEASGVPDFPEKIKGIIYTEIAFANEDEFDAIFEELSGIFEKLDISTESTWAGFSIHDLDNMKKFRHALPERINMIISRKKKDFPGITKVGTDMSVPDEALDEMMDSYIKLLEASDLEYYIFGHIGNGHLHINIIPDNEDELQKAKQLYREFAGKAVFLKGSVAAEHGIGRLKKDFLKIQFSEEEINVMKEIKNKLDPGWILNPGVLW
jgi:D-lactate dehydrogenase (cytochrome)